MIKVVEAFAGVGSQTQALKNIGVPHEVVGIIENDPYALKSYALLHGETPNLGDITKIDPHTVPDHDLYTYSFPCQDISIAGEQEGADRDSETRSSLLWNSEDIIRAKKPKYLLMENVKNLVGQRHKSNFDKWIQTLSSIGYTTHWGVLNAKDFGIPQNRERVFAISIRNDLNQHFNMPTGFELGLSVSDLLEKDRAENLIMNHPLDFVEGYENMEIINNQLNMVGRLDMRGNDTIRRVYHPNGICPTLTTMEGGHRQPKFYVDGKVVKTSPKECWRLMGFTDEDFSKVEGQLSNAQLYKQAGNSIVVTVLEEIFRKLLL